MTTLSRREFAAAAAAGLAAPLTGARQPKAETPVTVPARAVTRGPKHHWFGYYDKTPWDATGRYLLAHEIDFVARQPTADEKVTVGMADLKNKDEFIPLGTTAAWSWQQGAMLQWVGTNPGREVVYNATADGKPAAIVHDTQTHKSRVLPRPVYGLSPDGSQTVTLDFARLHRLRPGYGYASYTEQFADDPAPDKLGIWQMDLKTGKNALVVTLKQLAAYKPDERFQGAHHWVNHLQFSPGGTRFAFLHRWRVGEKAWFTRLFAARPDGSDLRLLMDTGMVSHYDWRDDDTILAWARTKEQGDKFYLIDAGGKAPQPVFPDVTRDGHCSYSPDRKWVLNDTYPDKDRMQHLMLVKAATGRRYDLNAFHSPPRFTGPARCDLHPRWNRTGTMVCVDGCHEATRQVYVLDVGEVVKS